MLTLSQASEASHRPYVAIRDYQPDSDSSAISDSDRAGDSTADGLHSGRIAIPLAFGDAMDVDVVGDELLQRDNQDPDSGDDNSSISYVSGRYTFSGEWENPFFHPETTIARNLVEVCATSLLIEQQINENSPGPSVIRSSIPALYPIPRGVFAAARFIHAFDWWNRHSLYGRSYSYDTDLRVAGDPRNGI